jgi:ABC-type transport system involved in multi-copper enzyme maturation permease subunit
MSALVYSEVQRALSRRAVRVLIGLAVFGIAITGVLVYVNAADQADPFVFADLWSGTEDSHLLGPIALLAIGGFVGGATVAGAEWRAGTMVGLLTWEARRHRVLLARLMVVTAVASAVAVLLLALFVAALVPAGARSSFGALDGGWWLSLLGLIGRGALVTGATAALGACVGSLGRNTSVALGAAFAYATVVENLLHGFRPGWARWSLIETIGTVVLGTELRDTVEPTNGPVLAAVLLVAYVAACTIAALLDFRRRDV